MPTVSTHIRGRSTSPGALQTIVQTGQLPAGVYECTANAYISGAGPSLQAIAQVATPGAGATIVSIANIPAGLYTVNWSYRAQTTTGLSDNMKLQLNGVDVPGATSSNVVSAGQPITQLPFVVSIPANGTLSVVAIAADATGTYRAALSIIPLNGGCVDGVDNDNLFWVVDGTLGPCAIPMPAIGGQTFTARAVIATNGNTPNSIKLSTGGAGTVGLIYNCQLIIMPASSQFESPST